MTFRNNNCRFLVLALLFALAFFGDLSLISPRTAAGGMRARVRPAYMPPSVPFTVVGWGDNSFGSGQLNIPAGLTNVTAISAGFSFGLALKSDGTVTGWGDGNGTGAETPPPGLTGVTAIAAGGFHSLALKSDGTVVGWGDDSYGQATSPAGLINVVAIAAGATHSLALLSDGTVVGWGSNTHGETTIPAGLSNVTAISAGFSFGLALKSDGTVVGWGVDFSNSGAETPPAGLNAVTAIAAGGFHSLALKSDGTVVGWGDNTFACQATPPSCVSGAVAIAAGYVHSLAMQVHSCVQIGCTASNNPPTIAAVANSRQQGAPASASTIATVSDSDQSLGSLTVTVNDGASATVNGVTVSGLTNTNGTITATIGASCTATNADFTLQVKDDQGATAIATLTISVTTGEADADHDGIGDACEAPADLRLTKTAKSKVKTGTRLIYVVTVRNLGPNSAPNVVITDSLSAGTTFVRADPTRGSCSNVGNLVTCNIGNLANHRSAAVEIVVRVAAPNGTILNNTAQASSSHPDPNLSNNTGSARTRVVRPNDDDHDDRDRRDDRDAPEDRDDHHDH